MNRGLFVTGTDTGVGKTLVTAAIATVLRRRGTDVGVMKPVATGCVRRGRPICPVPLSYLFCHKASFLALSQWGISGIKDGEVQAQVSHPQCSREARQFLLR